MDKRPSPSADRSSLAALYQIGLCPACPTKRPPRVTLYPASGGQSSSVVEPRSAICDPPLYLSAQMKSRKLLWRGPRRGRGARTIRRLMVGSEQWPVACLQTRLSGFGSRGRGESGSVRAGSTPLEQCGADRRAASRWASSVPVAPALCLLFLCLQPDRTSRCSAL